MKTYATFQRVFTYPSRNGAVHLHVGVGADGTDTEMVDIVVTQARTTISIAMTKAEWQQLVSDINLVHYMTRNDSSHDDAQPDAQEEQPSAQFSHIEDIAPIVTE